jgi:hypothetical protein
MMRIGTTGCGAGKYDRTIRIMTNDPQNPTLAVRLIGDVKKFVTMTPSAVFLTGKAGEPVTATIRIVPETEPAFKLLQINVKNGKDIRHFVTEKEEDGKKVYELLIENTAESVGRYSDRITLITDRSDQGPLIVNIRGNILPAADTAPTE